MGLRPVVVVEDLTRQLDCPQGRGHSIFDAELLVGAVKEPPHGVAAQAEQRRDFVRGLAWVSQNSTSLSRGVNPKRENSSGHKGRSFAALTVWASARPFAR
ncbi:MAG TPA: hypothetical protein VM580_22915 [Labilithrix sp.]|nr:hypothetical protein [Labilithrix sp.]